MRKIDYLRISVTDRCNLRCIYCMPEKGIKFIPHKEILSFEEIEYLVKLYAENLGITKVRLTGGEPLVRKGILSLVRSLNNIEELTDISMTTNGIYLSEYAKELFDTGLKRINISLDTLDPEQYSKITRVGNLNDVLKGIDAALKVGFTNVKLNAVIINDLNVDQIIPLTELILRLPVSVRFIEYMPINGDRDKFFPADKMIELIKGKHNLEKVDVKIGNGPAIYYKIPNAKGYVGFITAMSNHFCSSCNRMRLTSDGKLRPCLLSNIEVDIKNILRGNLQNKNELLIEKFKEALNLKPIHHHLVDEDIDGRRMYGIGG
jgi:cyclic pyranopterin phosphate synthase